MFAKVFLGFLNWCSGCVPRQLIHKTFNSGKGKCCTYFIRNAYAYIFFRFSSALVNSFGARGKACGPFGE
jgi:hypothetical protein